MFKTPTPVKFNPRKVLGYSNAANHVELRGELGERLARSVQRISEEAPYSVEYLLNQIHTDESSWTNFPCCHGDIAGRWIWAQALAHSTCEHPPHDVEDIARKTIELQKPDGHFGNETITEGVETMLGAYGNGWMLKGLSVFAQLFPGGYLESAIKSHVQWYIDQFPYWEDIVKQISERGTEYYAVTPSGYFHGLAGLSTAFKVTGDKRIPDLANKFIRYVAKLDDADHSHSFLTVRRGILDFAELNQDFAIIDEVQKDLERVWSEFVMESGGIPERFIRFDDGHVHDDEGCSHADWMLLCFKLHRLLGDDKWLERGLLCLENQFYYNQTINGGFGARLIYDNKYLQMGKEGYWCCSLFGPAVMIESAGYLVSLDEDLITILHPIEGKFTFNDQVVELTWDKGYQRYVVDLTNAKSIKQVNIHHCHWVQWQKEISGDSIMFTPEWKFWNALPQKAPSPTKVEEGGVYTQFVGPWMLVARSAQDKPIPILPMKALANQEKIEGMQLKTMYSMPQSSKTLMALLPSDIKINKYDVFSWPKQPCDQIMLYPLKDKESPDNMFSWFKAG